MWPKSATDTVTGYKYTSSFDGAEDVLVVKFANKQDITMGRGWLSENLEVFEDIRKMQRISAQRKEYVSMDNCEICEVVRRTIDNVLGAKQQLYEHFKVELEADRLLFI